METQVRGRDVLDGSICRSDLNVLTSGQAVIRRILEVANSGVKVTNDSTGADAGTGDVKLALDWTYLSSLYATKNHDHTTINGVTIGEMSNGDTKVIRAGGYNFEIRDGSSAHVLRFPYASADLLWNNNKIWNEGNLNRSDTPFAASTGTFSGSVTTNYLSTITGGIRSDNEIYFVNLASAVYQNIHAKNAIFEGNISATQSTSTSTSIDLNHVYAYNKFIDFKWYGTSYGNISNEGGSQVNMTLNGSVSAGGINVNGNDFVTVLSSYNTYASSAEQLKIYHSGSTINITNQRGVLKFGSDSEIAFTNAGNTDYQQIRARNGDSAQWNTAYNNSRKISQYPFNYDGEIRHYWNKIARINPTYSHLNINVLAQQNMDSAASITISNINITRTGAGRIRITNLPLTVDRNGGGADILCCVDANYDIWIKSEVSWAPDLKYILVDNMGCDIYETMTTQLANPNADVVGLNQTRSWNASRVLEPENENVVGLVNSGNNYGFGTLAPAEKLEVNGNIKAWAMVSGSMRSASEIIFATANGGAYQAIRAQDIYSQNTIQAGGNISAASATISGNGSFGAGMRISSNAAEGEIVATTGRGLKFYTNDGLSNPLVLSTTGAATFTGNIITQGTINAASTITGSDFILSDRRLKTRIRTISLEPSKIQFKEFEMKSAPGVKRYGVIAQELMKTNPELVHRNGEGYYAVNYVDLLIREVAILKGRVAELEGRIN